MAKPWQSLRFFSLVFGLCQIDTTCTMEPFNQFAQKTSRDIPFESQNYRWHEFLLMVRGLAPTGSGVDPVPRIWLL